MRKILPFAFTVLLILGSVLTLDGLGIKNTEESLQLTEQAVRGCAVQCYAIEGRYPPSVEYLEEHYGIVIDRDRYHVFYDGWASNVMPDITVLPVAEEEKGDETW